jgi:RNA polymerase sigma-70 factor (TIGR02943 family)
MALDSQRKAELNLDPVQWVDRYGDAMLRFALARVGRIEIAEDLVQEAFLAAWQARETFDGRSSFSTWLGGILRRKIADFYRRAGRDMVLAQLDRDVPGEPLFTKRGKWAAPVAHWKESPVTIAENSEFWKVMAHCMAQLPVHLAEAFRLREMRHASVEEICSATGVTPKNLSVRLHRARLLLRRCLDQRCFQGGA